MCSLRGRFTPWQLSTEVATSHGEGLWAGPTGRWPCTRGGAGAGRPGSWGPARQGPPCSSLPWLCEAQPGAFDVCVPGPARLGPVWAGMLARLRGCGCSSAETRLGLPVQTLLSWDLRSLRPPPSVLREGEPSCGVGRGLWEADCLGRDLLRLPGLIWGPGCLVCGASGRVVGAGEVGASQRLL